MHADLQSASLPLVLQQSLGWIVAQAEPPPGTACAGCPRTEGLPGHPELHGALRSRVPLTRTRPRKGLLPGMESSPSRPLAMEQGLAGTSFQGCALVVGKCLAQWSERVFPTQTTLRSCDSHQEWSSAPCVCPATRGTMLSPAKGSHRAAGVRKEGEKEEKTVPESYEFAKLSMAVMAAVIRGKWQGEQIH